MSVQANEELLVLNRKLDELIGKYRVLKAELTELRVVNESLMRKVSERDERIKNLEDRYDRIKLSGALLGEGESATEAKRKLGELVREIDRCVALLNR